MQNNKDIRIVALAGIVFGACNLVGIIGEVKWYKILCFAMMGLPPLLLGLLSFSKIAPEKLRSLSWLNLIEGLSILIMASSDFYAADMMPFLNFVAALGLIAAGFWGLLRTVRVYKLSLIP